MRRAAAVIVAALLLLSQTACYGLRQINELGLVTAVGLDVGEKPGSVKLSVQIIRPADARGQTGAPAGGTGQPIYSVTAEGRTIFEAIRNLSHFTSRRVYWAHNFVIVMQEKYAREGIEDMIDFFTRNHELRMSTWVAVTSDSPAELISTITGLEVVPGEAVDRLYRNNHLTAQAPASNMRNLEEAFLSRSAQPVVARLQLVPRGISNKKPEQHGSLMQVELAGAAAFHEGKMKGWLSVEETRGMLFFLEKLRSGIEVVSCPNSSEQISLEFRQAKFKIQSSYVHNKPAFQIRISTDADIVESACTMPLDTILPDLEQQLAEQLKKEIEAAINKAQHEYRTDFLKLSDVFRNQHPMEWREIAKDWDTLMAESDINLLVEAKIKSAVVKTAEAGVK
ncbi:MAG: germination protein Ger(x)C family [Paenibacillus sp.]|jgi:spore germination protein KC|nr:germination protein Ger(x)C family [Paenibacillus sp.]